MSLNPVISLLGRRLRLAVVGGGSGSFIGAMHRQSARLDDRYEIVTGVLSSNPEKARQAGRELGFAPDRLYTDVKDLLQAESARADGIDAVAIMTPNDSHFDYSMAALERDIDVICDKPMTNTLAEAEALHAKVQQTGLVFCLTHNYTGYPMVRQARAMVADGQLGTIRLVQVEYVQGGKADEEKVFSPDNWKFDPVRGGPSRVMGDIGTHAHNLTRFITGLEVDEVAAEIGAIVPGRQIHDYAGAPLSKRS
ncbi:MAG: Gfo/Idh/MocA family oxidoreductase, partial [Anaerolineales bacterium]